MQRDLQEPGPLGHVLALIPARGGSKSVPRKNIRLVLGKPLIAYSIEQALASRNISRVVVTTDSPEIAEIARRFGADVPFLRPAEIAEDLSLDIDFHRHALDWLADHRGYEPRYVVNLRPTHPIRLPETIDKAIEVFDSRQDADSLRSVRLSEFSPYKMWRIGDDGLLLPTAALDGVAEPYNQPRQTLPIAYWQDGYVDVTRPSVIREQGSTTGRRVLPFLIEEACMDVDYEDQLVAVERLLSGKTEDVAPADSGQKRAPSGVRHPS